MNTHDFLLFALASLLLNITPGNDMLFVITRSTGQGVKAGIVASLGIMVGCMIHILAAVAGISAVIASSAIAFSIIKYIGAGYLIYLGIRSLLQHQKDLLLEQHPQVLPYRKLFWQGVITNALNPKVALFFLAFLPQFINPTSGSEWQVLLLGVWFDLSGTLVNILVAILFARIGHWFSQSPKFVRTQQKITGVLLIGLGIRVALTSRK